MQPKISIITISYNSVKTIEETIKSVLSQEYSNLEYIIIDANSTDGTVDIIKKYENELAYWVSEPDKGISDGFNKGILVATGDIIGIVNSDDIYLPGTLNTVAQAYEEGIDVYRGAIMIHNDEKNEEYTYQPSMKFGMIPINVNVCHLPTFITKKAYEKYGLYDVDFKLAMDLDLLRRFYYAGAKFKKINAVLGKFNVGGVSTTTAVQKSFVERKKVILKNGGNYIHVIIYQLALKLIGIYKVVVPKILKKDYKSIRY